MKPKYGNLPFDAQIAFFRRKRALTSQAWTDIWQEEHDHAFAVAGANLQALVEDFQQAINKAIEQGTTLTEFRKDFDKIVAEHGWSYNGGRGWRTRVIYDTNIRTSYQAGRYKQLRRMDFWQYHHSPASENARKQHLAWDGLILPKDDPFWQTHYPPNGWGCKCTVTGHSKSAMQRKGLSPGKSPAIKWNDVVVGVKGPSPRSVRVPDGVSPGFAYAPGHSWARQMTPAPDGLPIAPLPPTGAPPPLPMPRSPQPVPLPADWSDAKYMRWFLDEMGANGKPWVIHKDPTGAVMVITKEMFTGRGGKLKLRKNDRHLFLPTLAATLKDPDQIRLALQPVRAGNPVVRRRYIKVFDTQPYGMAVFEWDGKQWQEVTLFHVTDQTAKDAGFTDAEVYVRSYLVGKVLHDAEAKK